MRFWWDRLKMDNSLLSAIIGVASALTVVILSELLARKRETHNANLSEKRRIYSDLLVTMAELKSDSSRPEYRRRFMRARTLFLVAASSKLLYCLRDYEKYLLDNKDVVLDVLEKKERALIQLMRKDLRISKRSIKRDSDLPSDVYLYNLTKM